MVILSPGDQRVDSAAAPWLTGPVRFAKVTLQGFRNLPLAEVALAGRRTFLCGANAQGKTNFLEAVGYVTALRSFRGAESRALPEVSWRGSPPAVGTSHTADR